MPAKKKTEITAKTTNSRSATSARAEAKKPVRKAKPVKKAAPKTDPVVSKPVSSPINFDSLRNNKKVLIAGIVILALGILYYLFKDQIFVASVNGRPISRIALIQELEKESGKKALETLITKHLVFEEANKKNVQVSDADVDAEIKKLEGNIKKQGSSLDSVLQMQGLTRDQLKDEFKIRLLLKKLIGKQAAVSDKEVADYMEKNKEAIPAGTKKEEVKAQLEDSKLNQLMPGYIESLRSKAKVYHYLYK